MDTVMPKSNRQWKTVSVNTNFTFTELKVVKNTRNLVGLKVSMDDFSMEARKSRRGYDCIFKGF
jgi:hypothetical protein